LQYPLQRVPERGRLPAFLALLLLTLGVGLAMPSPPKTLEAPWGIVSLELAGDVQKARAILASWGDEGWRRAVSGVRLDFLFLLCYSTVIAAACVWGPSPFRGRRGGELAAILAWGQWTAAFLDALENIALLKMLLGETVRQPWPRIALGCAVPKFVLVGAGLAYAAVGAVVWFMKR
jgi:hypothetical protein